MKVACISFFPPWTTTATVHTRGDGILTIKKMEHQFSLAVQIVLSLTLLFSASQKNIIYHTEGWDKIVLMHFETAFSTAEVSINLNLPF